MTILPVAVGTYRDTYPPNDVEERLSLRLQVGVDPRMKLAREWNVDFTEVTDDLGNDLVLKGQSVGFLMGGVPSPCRDIYWGLQMPPHLGTKITYARAQVHLSVVLAQTTVAIDDVQKLPGQTHIHR